MFSLTIVFGASAPVLWTFLFQDEARATQAYDELLALKHSGLPGGAMAGVSDDFSQRAVIGVDQIAGFMLEDLDKSQLGQVEKALHDRRAQVKFEALVNAEPGLRQQQRHPSMPILQPMGNGFRPVS